MDRDRRGLAEAERTLGEAPWRYRNEARSSSGNEVSMSGHSRWLYLKYRRIIAAMLDWVNTGPKPDRKVSRARTSSPDAWSSGVFLMISPARGSSILRAAR